MQKLPFAAILAFNLAGPVFAQAPAVLIEACNSIADAERRLECLKAAMSAGKQSAPAAPSFDAVERAYSDMAASLSTGISYNNYLHALLALGRELAAYAAKAPPEAKEALAKLEESLDTYKDAGTFWETAIRFYSRRDNGLSYFGGLPVGMVGLDWMVRKHGLPTRNADLLGINVGVPTDAGRSAMWIKARRLAGEGIDLLKAPAPKTTQPEPAATPATPATPHDGINRIGGEVST